jgi:hypothetical protein
MKKPLGIKYLQYVFRSEEKPKPIYKLQMWQVAELDPKT